MNIIASLDDINKSLNHNADVFKGRLPWAITFGILAVMLGLAWHTALRYSDNDLARRASLPLAILLGVGALVWLVAAFGALFAGVGGSFMILMLVLGALWLSQN